MDPVQTSNVPSEVTQGNVDHADEVVGLHKAVQQVHSSVVPVTAFAPGQLLDARVHHN